MTCGKSHEKRLQTKITHPRHFVDGLVDPRALSMLLQDKSQGVGKMIGGFLRSGEEIAMK
jgi:hypothetical protein